LKGELLKFYDQQASKPNPPDHEQLQRVRSLLLPLLEEMRWVREYKAFQFIDKVELLKKFKLKNFKAGDRLDSPSDTLDTYYLIV
jgi:hypothetical protein